MTLAVELRAWVVYERCRASRWRWRLAAIHPRMSREHLAALRRQANTRVQRHTITVGVP